MRKLNDELDKRVAERTAQLEAAIREQVAFSYPVSHDLRSPLRHINSYAAILAEEGGADITPKGRDYLERICKASSKMGRLIDDLLQLARMSRSPLTEERVDLSRLATISSLMLRQTDKARKVDFSIAAEMEVLGDKTLLNLPSQAVAAAERMTPSGDKSLPDRLLPSPLPDPPPVRNANYFLPEVLIFRQ